MMMMMMMTTLRWIDDYHDFVKPFPPLYSIWIRDFLPFDSFESWNRLFFRSVSIAWQVPVTLPGTGIAKLGLYGWSWICLCFTTMCSVFWLAPKIRQEYFSCGMFSGHDWSRLSFCVILTWRLWDQRDSPPLFTSSTFDPMTISIAIYIYVYMFNMFICLYGVYCILNI